MEEEKGSEGLQKNSPYPQ